MDKGKLYLTSLSGIKNATQEVLNSKKLFIVRSKGSIDCEKYGFIHTPQLSPSKDLWSKYLKWRQLEFTDKEVEIIRSARKNETVSNSWFVLYNPLFQKEMRERADMVKALNRLVQLLEQGQDITLICYCSDYKLCHRTLIGEYISNLGYSVSFN